MPQGRAYRAPMASVLLHVRIALWRLRHLLLLAVVLGTGWYLARALMAPPPPTVPVVVTAQDVAAGTELTHADLRVVHLPPSAAPDEPMSVADAVGAAPVVALPSGVPVLPALLGQDRFDRRPPPGSVTVPVRLADPAVAALLRPGDRIDVVAQGPDAERAVVLARRAVVLDLVPDEQAAGWLTAGDATGLVTVVAVTPAEGHLLAGSGWGWLGAVLVEGS